MMRIEPHPLGGVGVCSPRIFFLSLHVLRLFLVASRAPKLATCTNELLNIKKKSQLPNSGGGGGRDPVPPFV